MFISRGSSALKRLNRNRVASSFGKGNEADFDLSSDKRDTLIDLLSRNTCIGLLVQSTMFTFVWRNEFVPAATAAESRRSPNECRLEGEVPLDARAASIRTQAASLKSRTGSSRAPSKARRTSFFLFGDVV